MTTMPPVEIELKLALPPDQVAAFLKLMARRRSVPARRELVTRYFDTADSVLSAQGIAIRIRKVGRRWLQTLKTEGIRQGGLSHRTEYEMPISDDQLDWSRFPAAAQAWVTPALRTQLIPLFETRFSRTAWLVSGRGGATIEVALDVGEVCTLAGTQAGARCQPICEIELELKTGKPDAVFALAQTWVSRLDVLPLDVSKAERGVRLLRGLAATPVTAEPAVLQAGMRVEKGFAAITQACLAQFQANLPGVLASDDIEYVHQARMALRRLRVALQLFRRACVLPADMEAGLKRLAAALGPVRDWDVLCCETLPAIAPCFTDEAAWQAGRVLLEAQRARQRDEMRAALGQAHPGAWLLACQRWLLQQGWRDCSETRHRVQHKRLREWARRKLRKGQASISSAARDYALRNPVQLSPAESHALRMAIRRQRYAAEFFQMLFDGRRHARCLKLLQAAQAGLGRSNDRHVARRLLAETDAAQGPMGSFVLGWLAGCEASHDPGSLQKQLKKFVKMTSCW